MAAFSNKPFTMMRLVSLLLLAVAVLLGGCSSQVARIDLNNEHIPIEDRRLLADAEDGTSIARARLIDAKQELDSVTLWRDRTLAAAWPPDRGTLQALQNLANGRVELAQLHYELAEAELELSNAKLDQMTAETAIRNDLAIYELEPLTKRVEDALTNINEIGGQIARHQQQLDKITSEWWRSFGGFANSGQPTHPFYTEFGQVEADPVLPDEPPPTEEAPAQPNAIPGEETPPAEAPAEAPAEG